MAAEYEGSVEQVHRAFGDEQYWLERLADSGADDYSLDSMTVNGEGIDVVTTQTLRADRLPGVVTQFHRGDLSFVREETWTPISDGQATAPLFVTAEFMNDETGEIKSQTVLVDIGDFPLMTDKGTFVINGTERVVVSQLVR